jgi:adenylylsulfate kinase
VVSTDTSGTGFAIWLTDASGEDGPRIAGLLAGELAGRGLRADVVDGHVASAASSDPATTDETPETRARRIAWGCGLLARNGIVAIAWASTPGRDMSPDVRSQIGRLVEVDVAMAGEAPAGQESHGSDEPVTLRTEPGQRPEEAVARIVGRLEELGYVAGRSADAGAAYTPDEESEVTDRLRDLGYL